MMNLVVLEKAMPVRTGQRVPQGGKRKGHKAYTRTVRGKAQTVQQRGIVGDQPKGRNPYHALYGHLNLSQYPTADVKRKTIQKNMKGNIHTHWILRWRHPQTEDWQYGYTKRGMENRQRDNFMRVRDAAKQIPKILKQAGKDVRTSKDEKTRVTALMTLLIGQGHFRIGEEDDVRKHGTYGVSTFRVEHVKFLRGNRVRFQFGGKKEVAWSRTLKVDPKIYKMLRNLGKHKDPEDNFFTFTRHTGRVQPIRKLDVNEYLKEHGRITSKDLRTYYATAAAHAIIKKYIRESKEIPDAVKDEASAQKQAAKVMTSLLGPLAEEMGHETKTLIGSYADPSMTEDTLVDHWMKGLKKSFDEREHDTLRGMGEAVLQNIEEHAEVGLDGEMPVLFRHFNEDFLGE